jgi:hypothetical protein
MGVELKNRVHWISFTQDIVQFSGRMNTAMNVRFHVLMAASMKMTVFWDIPQYYLVEVDRRFRGASP